jgi:hypothetical protein
MLLLLAVPVVAAVALADRLFQAVAPSNILIARVRSARPSPLRAGTLASLAMMLLVLGHCLTVAIASGAPGWLNFMVLVLLWDAIKVMLAAVILAARSATAALRRLVRRTARRHAAAF